MKVLLNGEPRELTPGATVADLVRELGFSERRVAVELNRDVLPREEYVGRALREGDVLEVVHFVGGG